jgi:hypothetical protein
MEHEGARSKVRVSEGPAVDRAVTRIGRKIKPFSELLTLILPSEQADAREADSAKLEP